MSQEYFKIRLRESKIFFDQEQKIGEKNLQINIEWGNINYVLVFNLPLPNGWFFKLAKTELCPRQIIFLYCNSNIENVWVKFKNIPMKKNQH